MAILKIKDADGNWISIPAIKGEKGDKGDAGEGSVQALTNQEIEDLINNN